MKDNKNNQHAKQHARNGLGLCYLKHYKDLDSADGCFRAILHCADINADNENFHGNWTGISKGNLGHVMIERKEYDKAIPLFENSIEEMLKYKDYAFASNSAIGLAEAYLKKGNPSKAKIYIDLSKEYYYHNNIPRISLLPRIYEIFSRYYAAIGNSALSMAYMDSTLYEDKKLNEEFSALQLMRVKERHYISEQKIKEEQLLRKIKKRRLQKEFHNGNSDYIIDRMRIVAICNTL